MRGDNKKAYYGLVTLLIASKVTNHTMKMVIFPQIRFNQRLQIWHGDSTKKKGYQKYIIILNKSQMILTKLFHEQ